METSKTGLEQTDHLSLETRIRNLRAERKTYREIAEILHVSIAQISRVLNKPKNKEENAPTQEGVVASRVFQLLEKGMTLPQIVIKLRLQPEVVEDLYSQWIGLKKIDANQPNLGKINQKLNNHIADHYSLDVLLDEVRNIGVFRNGCCVNRPSDSERECDFYQINGEIVDNEDAVLHCAFCTHFQAKEYVINLGIPHEF